ncbi:hypothetical protein [Nannocystis pusilla]
MSFTAPFRPAFSSALAVCGAAKASTGAPTSTAVASAAQRGR